ncbi:MAG: zinc-binding dehydrogenase, partial [Micrococcales bacterium]|nr:zinc-binding dehydrogenase [Micrococcales bacterium]
TLHRCINYGSYWQARCLVEGLDGAGNDVRLLEHRSSPVDRAEWRCALQPELPAVTRPDARAGYSRKIRKFLEAFEALPRTEPFPLDDPTELDVFDLVVVGSETGGRWLGGLQRSMAAAALSPFVRQRLVMLVARERAEDLAELVALVDAGRVRPSVERVFPLAETAAAVEHVATGRARGKVVVRVAEPPSSAGEAGVAATASR